MPKSHVMLDLETLGTAPGCAVLSIGAVAFSKAGVAPDGFYATLPLAPQRRAGMHEDPDTVAWWVRQSPEARSELDFAAADTTPLQDPLRNFAAWCRDHASPGNLLVWGNGADFDQPILRAVYKACALPLPWGPWNSRCYRTLKNLRPGLKLTRSGTHHNALDDARSQAAHAVQLLEELGLWGAVN